VHGCSQGNVAESTTCASMFCPAEIAEAGPGLGKAISYETCLANSMCSSKCADASTRDARPNDAPAD
jgi:hypothetical protein